VRNLIIRYPEAHKTLNSYMLQKYVVPQESACLDESEGIFRHPLERNHYNLNKFGSPAEEAYRSVTDAIVMMATRALAKDKQHSKYPSKTIERGDQNKPTRFVSDTVSSQRNIASGTPSNRQRATALPSFKSSRAMLNNLYRKALLKHPYGYALYEPESSKLVKPGVCGYINHEDGRFIPLIGARLKKIDLGDPDSLALNGLSALNDLQIAEPDERSWGPKTSRTVKGVKVDTSSSNLYDLFPPIG
jgi:hypothetical protein